MVNKKRIAEKLNGINFPCEISMDMVADLAISNLVAVFAVSDDLVYLKGSISEEIYALNGDYILFDSKGIIKNECEEKGDCPYFLEKSEKSLVKIEVGDFEFITDIPHEEFKIYEDGEVYCIGIVFDMKDLSTTEISPVTKEDPEVFKKAYGQLLMSLDFITEKYCTKIGSGGSGICNDCEIYSNCPKHKRC